jgi:hypothetical protein
MPEDEKLVFIQQNQRQKDLYSIYQDKLREYENQVRMQRGLIEGNEENNDYQFTHEEELQQKRKFFTFFLFNIFYVGNFIQLPLSRVRQVCQLDDDYRLIQKDALLMLTKAAELFV